MFAEISPHRISQQLVDVSAVSSSYTARTFTDSMVIMCDSQSLWKTLHIYWVQIPRSDSSPLRKPVPRPMWRNNRRKPIRNWERELQTRRNTILYKHQSWKNNRQSQHTSRRWNLPARSEATAAMRKERMTAGPAWILATWPAKT